MDILDEELAILKEQGMSCEEIAEHCKRKGIEISGQIVNKRLKSYYEAQGKKMPKVHKGGNQRIAIQDKELARLKETGMSCEEIAEYYKKKDIEISRQTIYKRLKLYYEAQGKEMPKAKRGFEQGKKMPRVRRMDIEDREWASLKEQGMSYREIVEYYKEKVTTISSTMENNRLKSYYEEQEKEMPNAKRGAKNGETPYQRKIIEEDVSSHKVQEISNEKKGGSQNRNKPDVASKKSVSPQGPKKYELLDEKLKAILMTGQSIKGYCLEHHCEQDEDKIKERLRRFKVIVEHSQKRGEQWVPDVNFLEVIKILESAGNLYPQNKYQTFLRPYIKRGVCEHGNIDTIQMNVFKRNKELMAYILLGCRIEYGEEYDAKVWNKIKTDYEAKVDKYFSRLYALEERARKRSENKLESIDTKKKKGSNLSDSDEQR